jgi:outer membrane protein assembly factor BamB
MFRIPFLLIALVGCADESSNAIEKPCTPDQSSPYSSGIPYLGIHADAGNSDVIQCESAEAFEEDWMALAGLGPTQPNTFSPDGTALYATTSNPVPEGCRVHALDAATGEVLWCKSYSPSVSLGAVEVDENGDLFFTTEAGLHSLTAEGEERWQAQLLDGETVDQPWGVHFTPDGHVATVTSSGVVTLVDRRDGAVLAQLSIPETYGFVMPKGLSIDLDLASLLPVGVVESIETLWGPQDSESTAGGFSSLLGGGAFSDNTVGISERGDIYVIGGGLDENSGALVQIRVEGTPGEPVMQAGWYTPIHGGSATSPSISRGGKYVVISDGTGSDTFFNPDAVEAWVKVMDIPACDANTDADPDPAVCGVSYAQQLERDPMIGAPTIDENGVVVFWEASLAFDEDPGDRDLAAFDASGILWEASLPDDMEWASVITATDNHVFGTASRITPSDEHLLTLNFPSVTDDYLVVLDRFTGEFVWRGELPDDGAATVSIGPDGALYVAVYGLLSMLAVDELPDPGLVRFQPIASGGFVAVEGLEPTVR